MIWEARVNVERGSPEDDPSRREGFSSRISGEGFPCISQGWADDARTPCDPPLPTCWSQNLAYEKRPDPEPDCRILPAGRYGGDALPPPRRPCPAAGGPAPPTHAPH